MKEAMFYHFEKDIIVCDLCPHNCHIKEGHSGLCNIRTNHNNILYTLTYEKISAIHVDPIEKKPLYGFLPNTQTLSVGSFGCNFYCKFCQNYSISKEIPDTQIISSIDLVDLALKGHYPSISYTYNEPTVFYEYVLETAKLAHEKGLKNILVTNGFINLKPLLELKPYIDAVNIDFKATNDLLYKKFCGGNQAVIYQTIRSLQNLHIEITFLIVPGINDNIEELEMIFKTLVSINQTMIIHITRYFPNYEMNRPATDINHMIAIQQVAHQYFKYVYLGNI